MDDLDYSTTGNGEEETAVLPRQRVLTRGKELADLLTLSRVFVAAAILVAACMRDKQFLAPVVLLTMLGWTTDVLDGRLANADAAPRKTWIGDHEFVADMLMVYAGMVYFMLAGFVPILPFALYALFSAGVARIWMRKSYTMAVAAPVAAMPLIFSFVEAPLLAWAFLGWIVLALILYWPRFKREVREFIEGVEE